MTFTSFGFLIFFPGGSTVYYCLPEKFRLVLAACQLLFYRTPNLFMLFLLAGITLVTYAFTILIDKAKTERKVLLVLDIVITLLPLFFFKYYNFINTGVYSLLNSAGFILPIWDFILYIHGAGLRNEYHEEIKPEKNLGISFCRFFPMYYQVE